MALYPCSADGQRYRGPSSAMYPALVKGNNSVREHLRLCEGHLNDLLGYCRQHLEEIVYDAPANTQSAMRTCCQCGGEPGDGRLVFVTAYPHHQDEAQFYGQVCANCDAKVLARFLLG